MVENNCEIISNENVDETLFKQIHALDNKTFRKLGPHEASSKAFLKRLFFSEHREAIFCLVNKENGDLAGHILRMFISDDARNKFLSDGNYSKLSNLGIQKGDNIMYHHPAVIDEKYRHTNAIKVLEYAFAKWLTNKKKEDKNLDYVFATIVSPDGLRTVKRMGYEPIDPSKLNLDNLGNYYSPDNLENHIATMLSKPEPVLAAKEKKLEIFNPIVKTTSLKTNKQNEQLAI